MTSSYTFSESVTFTVTHARHIAAKVATDLKRMQRFYGRPSDREILDYENEVIELLKGGFLQEVTYGFFRNGRFIEPTVRYTARDLTSHSVSDDPGRIRPGANIVNAHFYTYLIKTDTWFGLSDQEKQEISKKIRVNRGDAPQPGVDGEYIGDKVYSAGGRALDRSTVRSA